MLTPFIAILVLAGIWLNARALANQIRGLRHRRMMWLGVTALVAVAMLVGFYALVRHNYSLGSRLRVQGLPLPLVSFVFEDGEWTAFPIQPPLAYLAIAANMLVPVLLVFWGMRLILRHAQNGTRIGASSQAKTD